MEQKFYLVLIQKFVDQTQPSAKAIYEYSTPDEAIIAFYNELSYAMSGDNILSIMANVIDDSGDDIRREYWVRHIEPTPEPEDDENSDPDVA